MTHTYKLIGKIGGDGGIIPDVIHRTSDNAYIPKDPANTDYAEYLEWVAAGNTAEAAD